MDSTIALPSKLHGDWALIAERYHELWNHTYADDAEQKLMDIMRQEREASNQAVRKTGYDIRRMEKWEKHVFQSYQLEWQND